jgi:V/A-type H+-transporting ATPase subunit E
VTTEESNKTSSGVQELISRLRDEGVQAGSQEAERLLAEARREAAELIERAHKESARLREQTHIDVEKERESATNALKLASRDTVLELREAVSRHFEQHVKRLVSEVTIDTELVKSMILVLAGHAASEFVRDRDAEILVAHLMFDAGEENENENENAHAEQRAHKLVLGITGDMLREGVELLPDTDISGGARVRVKGQNAEVDLSDEAVTQLLMKHLLPRFQAILSGEQ